MLNSFSHAILVAITPALAIALNRIIMTTTPLIHTLVIPYPIFLPFLILIGPNLRTPDARFGQDGKFGKLWFFLFVVIPDDA